MSADNCSKKLIPQTLGAEDLQTIKNKARTFSFAELAEQDEMESILFKSFIIAAEHMDEVERLRTTGEKSWSSKLSPVRVGFWKALESWTAVAHPELPSKPPASRSRNKNGADEEVEPVKKPKFIPDLTIPTEPVIWRDVLHWEKGKDFPLIRDTGIRTETIVSYLLDNGTVEILLGAHPELSMTDVIACQEFDKEDQVARADYIKNYRDNQRMSPLHPDFVRARSYPKTPRPQYGPALGLIVACFLFLGGAVLSAQLVRLLGAANQFASVHPKTAETESVIPPATTENQKIRLNGQELTLDFPTLRDFELSPATALKFQRSRTQNLAGPPFDRQLPGQLRSSGIRLTRNHLPPRIQMRGREHFAHSRPHLGQGLVRERDRFDRGFRIAPG